MTRIGRILLLTVVAAILTAQAPGKSRVEGIVVNALDGKPIAGVSVTLQHYFWRANNFGGTLLEAIQNQAPRPEFRGPAPAPIVTDSNGQFVFEDVSEDLYRLTIEVDGYAPYIYGQEVAGGWGSLLHVAAGETRKGLVLEIAPTGIVTGTVTKRGGGPVESASVSLVRPAFHLNGARAIDVVATVKTNDRGEYRLFWVPPGRYYLRVVSSAAASAYGIDGRPRPVVREAFDGEAYYPGVPDLQKATEIQVAAGQEQRSADVVLDPVAKKKTFQIRGRVIDSRTAQPPRRAAIDLSTIEQQSQSFYPSAYDLSSGMFSFSGVPSGRYLLRVTTMTGWMGVMSLAEDTNVPDLDALFQTAIEVNDADITGVSLTLGNPSPTALRGKVSVEGTGITPDRLGIRLWPSANGSIVEGKGVTGGGFSQPDGSLSIDNPLLGEHIFTLSDLPMNAYVKRARFGTTDLLASPLRITNPLTDTLDIVVSMNAGSIRGTLQQTQGQPAPGLRAILIPVNRDRIDLYRTAISDRNGRFTIPGVTPGDYDIFSWQDIPPYVFFDSAFVSRFDKDAVRVHVDESVQTDAVITVLPAAEP